MTAKVKSTAMEMAYNLILQKVVRERMAPGTPLREEHLAEEFGISPTPVREALRSLEHEGWVQRVPYKGACLRKFSLDEIIDLYYLREALEGTAIRLALLRADASDWERLQKAIDADSRYLIEQPVEQNNCPASYNSDWDFHRAIVEASHSPLLLERNTTLRSQLSVLTLSSCEDTPVDYALRVHEEHRMIYDAMCRNWPDIAEKLLRQHISSGRERFCRLFADAMFPIKADS